jgi:hypothetical protein
MILIISNKWDISVDFFIRECRNRNLPYIRLNTEDIVHHEATISINASFDIVLTKDGTNYQLNDCITGIWIRRPGKVYEFQNDDKPSSAIQKFVHEQWAIWLEALREIEDVVWINDPYLSSKMENKAIQLKIARSVGFVVPVTLITNSARNVREHFVKNKQIIVKALYSPLIEEKNQDYFIFTNSISTDQLDDKEVSICPSIFQERLWPKKDYRITVVGSTVMCVEIVMQSHESENVDWRTLENKVEYRHADLPKDIKALCADYVKVCGLVFGAIDLIEHDGRFYFIEINPSGEWGWLQKQLNLPVAKSLANVFADNMEIN